MTFTQNHPQNAPSAHFVLSDEKRAVRVLQDVVRQETWTCYADLAEALKTRLAQLRLRYDSGLVYAAIDRLEEGGRRPVIQRVVATRVDWRQGEDRHEAGPGRDEAARLYQALMARHAAGRSTP